MWTSNPRVITADRTAAVSTPELDFEAFYDGNYSRILGYAARRLANMSDAEEVTAETFTRAYAHFATVARASAPAAWLFRTATNLVHDRFRQRARRREVSVEHDLEPLVEHLVDPAATQAEKLARLEEHARVQQQLGKLKRKYQDVLALRFVEEKAIDEIADILGIPPGTVKWRASKGLQKLGALLEKGEGRTEGRHDNR